MNDKRIRQLIIAILAVILVLGLLAAVSTALQLIVPLAILAAAAFAFYKIAIEGRDKPAAMQDEIAESAGQLTVDSGAEIPSDDARANSEAAAQERLSALQQAHSDFIDAATPAEEILDQIKERRQRLSGDDE